MILRSAGHFGFRTPSLLTASSTALEWPTLTTQWFPDVKEPEDKKYRIHRLLLGTHTSPGIDNYVQIAEVEIPTNVATNSEDYDDERGEVGGYGKSKDVVAIRFNIAQKIDHPDEVNKARYQPQNPDLIATFCVDGRILIFDRTKHSSQPTGKVNAQIECHGQKSEGYGLSWNPHEAGCLASGGEDQVVCLW
jgi:histone-binding protein RBBP4